jgi:hypothetical protein
MSLHGLLWAAANASRASHDLMAEGLEFCSPSPLIVICV